MTQMDTGTTIKVRCLRNDGYKASLTVGKIYNAIVAKDGSIGVWDNENECYGYPLDFFEVINE